MRIGPETIQSLDNALIYHEKARSVLVFSRKIRLAVREDVDEASRLLKEARKNVSAGA
jgi:hypothetical protein